MAFSIVDKAFRCDTGDRNTNYVLLVLACFANSKSGECWPSFTTLGKKCHMDRRSVIKCIHRLEELGIITINRAKGNSNQYRFSDKWLGQQDGPEPGVREHLGVGVREHLAQQDEQNGVGVREHQGVGVREHQGVGVRQHHEQGNITRKDNKEEIEEEKEKEKIIKKEKDDDDIKRAFEEIFWPAYPRKVAKLPAWGSFQVRAREWMQEHQSTVQAFAEMLVKDLDRRKGWFGSDKLHPTTYLNDRRWLDEPEGGNNSQSDSDDGKKIRRIVCKSGDVIYRKLTDEDYDKYLENYRQWQETQQNGGDQPKQ